MIIDEQAIAEQKMRIRTQHERCDEVLELSRSRAPRDVIVEACANYNFRAPGLVSRLFQHKKLTATQWFSIKPVDV